MEYIFRPKNGENTVEQDLLPKHQDTLKSSMVLIRRLLHDAQSKFRKMVEDNKKLAARIDGSINAASQEVNTLRVELLDTNKKLTEISESSNQQECGTQYDDECKYISYLPYVMMNMQVISFFCQINKNVEHSVMMNVSMQVISLSAVNNFFPHL